MKICEQCELFDHMAQFFIKTLSCGKYKPDDLQKQEIRDLVSVSFKNFIGTDRTSIRSVDAIISNPKYSHLKQGIEGYRTYLIDQLGEKCRSIADQIENVILPMIPESIKQSHAEY